MRLRREPKNWKNRQFSSLFYQGYIFMSFKFMSCLNARRSTLQYSFLFILLGLLTACGVVTEDSDSNKVTLTWNPAPTDTLGYIVYYGTTANNVTNQLLDIPVSANGFDPQAPKTEFDVRNDLHLASGDNVCFSLRAYNNEGLSEPSPAVCGYI